MMNRVLIIGLGFRGIKYIEYFLKNKYEVVGVCKTIKTKLFIENKYNINVLNSYENIIKSTFNYVVIALPLNIQGEVSLELTKKFKNKLTLILIESPISYDSKIVEKLKKYNNVIFMIDEYIFLLQKFFKRIDINSISNIYIDIFLSSYIYYNKNEKFINCVHLFNNFIGLDVNKINFYINFTFHEKNSFFYNIKFVYKGVKIIFIYSDVIGLYIGGKYYRQTGNFDTILECILNTKENFKIFFNIDSNCESNKFLFTKK